ncbi:MAG: hypothetical protein PF549_02735 [Patescibacteria group bacterium]|jgi:hypothetical protein|nr:hypothetical protein [Patescibacteria group bacterium]
MKKRIENIIKEFEEKKAELQKVKNIEDNLTRELIGLKAKADLLEEMSKDEIKKNEKST